MSHVTCHMSRAICHMSHVTCHMSHAKFLKGATVRPHGRATFFGDRTRFGFFNTKMHNLPLFYLFGSFLKNIFCFLPILFVQNFQTEILITEKKMFFRKSGNMSHVTCNFFYFFLFLQTGEAYGWRVCYQQGLPRLFLTQASPP